MQVDEVDAGTANATVSDAERADATTTETETAGTEKTGIEKSAEYWDEKHLTTEHHRREWHFHPAVLERQRRILRANTPEEWFIRNYIGTRLDRALGVGTGPAGLELRMLAHGAVEHFDLYEISQASLDVARQDARALNVEERASYICQDFHDAELQPESYDLVTFIASLHHMDRLEETVQKVYDCLKPGGMLFAAEYIGPNRFDFAPEHAILARQIYDFLDPALKFDSEPKLAWPTPAQVMAVDPTEAVQSEEIPAVIQRIFPRVETKQTYGTLCFMLFWCLNPDAIYDTEQGRKYDTEQGRNLVQFIVEAETALIDSGRLPSYFDYIVAFKPALSE
ncbi:MAG: class I SAM-dependent methyltransferase [Thermomicrobia bacterium]|nr:class I SAM-dependent methyltransferase [Thermomicrobia bacterium]